MAGGWTTGIQQMNTTYGKLMAGGWTTGIQQMNTTYGKLNESTPVS